MVAVHPQYVVDEHQRPLSVIVPIEEWQKILDELDLMEDIRLYDEATSVPDEAIPLEQAVREIREGLVK